MSTWETFLLGAIAGSTIFLGLPMARVRGLKLGVRAAMTAIATGILIFLLWDVLSNGVKPVTDSLDARHWSYFIPRVALLAVGFTVGPGAAAIEEFEHRVADHFSPAKRLSLLIATGIGLHNFGEGLAIGQSAA